ncbi:MAG: four helix bundle protein [Clostridia bacterium]|nr:four helix bundle protein [Clostridia bacterium]
MRDNKLIDLSIDFSVKIIRTLEAIKGHHSLINQLERSSTSIGANIHEANYAHSKADFISKLQIALKECYESEYWLQLFERTNLLPTEVTVELKTNCGTIRRLLIASINTAKK